MSGKISRFGDQHNHQIGTGHGLGISRKASYVSFINHQQHLPHIKLIIQITLPQ